MRIDQIAQPDVVVLDADATMDAAITQLSQHGIRHLVVTQDGVPVGVLSERDVLLHAFSDAENSQTGNIRIGTIMTSPIVALAPDDQLADAIRLMLTKQLSAIPLMSNGAPVGIATRTDVLKCFTDNNCAVPSTACRRQTIVEYMSTSVRSIDPDDSVSTAIRMMLDGHIRHLTVVRDGRLFGVVSDRDLLRGGPHREGSRPTCVAELRTSQHPEIRGVMSKHPVFLNPGATLADAAQQMVSHRIGAVPIVDGSTLAGLLTETDLLQVFLADTE